MKKKKTKTLYVCDECGASKHQWSGRCEDCLAWNSLKRISVTSSNLSTFENPSAKLEKLSSKMDQTLQTKDLKQASNLSTKSNNQDATPSHEDDNIIEIEDDLITENFIDERLSTSMAGFDRVLGGGFVQSQVILLGGEPGVGKSTLLLQILDKLNSKSLYICGEESIYQIKSRADRLAIKNDNITLCPENELIRLMEIAAKGEYKIVAIDSIQTLYWGEIDGLAGSITQLRASSQRIIQAAKQNNFIVILVGHVTKEGSIAGPKVIEHMVDTVIYFEANQSQHFRIVRNIKNRFGPTGEIGVFEMTARGLMEVENPSSIFIDDQSLNSPGSTVYAGIEGTMPLIMEVQALVNKSYLSLPRRYGLGYDHQRLSMILAILENKLGLIFGDKDVYLNITGGLKVSETACDLASAAALISALTNKQLPPLSAFCGELGLSGEIRPVNMIEARIKEATKLGFTNLFIPPLVRNISLDEHRKNLSLTKDVKINIISTLFDLKRLIS